VTFLSKSILAKETLPMQKEKKKKSHAQSMMKKIKKEKGEKDSLCPKGREKGEIWNHRKGVHTPFHPYTITIHHIHTHAHLDLIV
jgi:hypothetical protein